MVQEQSNDNTRDRTVALAQHWKIKFEHFALCFSNEQMKPRCALSNGSPGYAILANHDWFVRAHFAGYCNVCTKCAVNARLILFTQIKVIHFVPPNRNVELVWAFQRNDTVFYPLIEAAWQNVEVPLL